MKGSGTLAWKKKKKERQKARFDIPPSASLWWGGGPIRNIMSFLSLTQLALRCTADLPQCCTRHISGRWRDPAKEKQIKKKLFAAFFLSFIWCFEINPDNKEECGAFFFIFKFSLTKFSKIRFFFSWCASHSNWGYCKLQTEWNLGF